MKSPLFDSVCVYFSLSSNAFKCPWSPKQFSLLSSHSLRISVNCLNRSLSVGPWYAPQYTQIIQSIYSPVSEPKTESRANTQQGFSTQLHVQTVRTVLLESDCRLYRLLYLSPTADCTVSGLDNGQWVKQLPPPPNHLTCRTYLCGYVHDFVKGAQLRRPKAIFGKGPPCPPLPPPSLVPSLLWTVCSLSGIFFLTEYVLLWMAEELIISWT